MITTYLDEGCKTLKLSLGLKLADDYSTLWFCTEEESDFSRFLGFMVSTFNSFVGFFWLAFSGGAGSRKILELKRAFGHWSISKGDVVAKYDLLDEHGNRLYSDIAQINSRNIDKLASILNRTLFGVDSTVFFLPAGTALLSRDIVNPLTDLLVKRNGMKAIEERLLNQGLLESHITKIVSIGGIATVTVRDSNMCTMVAAIGSQFAFSQICKLMESKSPERSWKHIVNEQEFNKLLSFGVSISAFS